MSLSDAIVGVHNYDSTADCEWCMSIEPDCWLNQNGLGCADYMHVEVERDWECRMNRAGDYCPVHSERESE